LLCEALRKAETQGHSVLVLYGSFEMGLMTILQIGGAAVGAVVGAGVGFSGVLCPDGSCAITGTWFGGAAMGGAMGFAAAGVLPLFFTRKPIGGANPDDEEDPS